MGKPFLKELDLIQGTVKWASSLNIDALKQFLIENPNKPLLSIGSGGSLSACYYAELLYQQRINVAKSMTPLELIYSPHVSSLSKILFISSSGKNTDINIALQKALDYGCYSMANLSMKEKNKLKEILEKIGADSFNYEIPTGKDGFLATNSLIAFFVILYRCFETEVITNQLNIATLSFDSFIQNIDKRTNFTVLYGGWGKPVAFDIESKFIEAALGSIQLADYRNFGHGRHHWLDKQEKMSSVLALITPKEKQIALKTLQLIPEEIPKLIIETDIEGSLGCIDLLIKTFYLTWEIGKLRKIDPGKPGVPEFGSKLYNLKYASFYKTSNTSKELSIINKAKVSYDFLSKIEIEKWEKAYDKYLKVITNSKFNSIIFDYDGTISSSKDRFNKSINPKITEYIISFLDKDIRVGFATGRGDSIRDLLRNSIPSVYWNKILIGYYNGGQIGLLSDDNIPINDVPDVLFNRIDIELDKYIFATDDIVKKKKNSTQYTFIIKQGKKDLLKKILEEIVLLNKLNNILIIESSHSMDLIIKPQTSKLNLLNEFEEDKTLCIGDKGLFPGNDFELLSSKFSISVDETPLNPLFCWKFIPRNKNIKALVSYLEKITVNNGFFTIKL